MPAYSTSGYWGSKRRRGWDYAKREKGKAAAGVEYSYELTNADGAHFHLWVPFLHPELDVNVIRGAVKALKRSNDVVSWSWDYAPSKRALN